MKSRIVWASWMVLLLVAILGCKNGGDGGKGVLNSGASKGTLPQFTVAFSEYPSWTTFLVAESQGLVNGKAGQTGPLEEKWGVDLVYKEADYDTCITLFGSGTVDASCQTNIDSLSPSLGRKSVVICPTSTSAGADACIAVGINSIDELKGKTTFGLQKSVAEFAFIRNLQKRGLDPKDFPFRNMDPAAAANALQTGQENVQSIQVWNPFVLQTLRTQSNAKDLFNSSDIAEEIIDAIVVGADALDKPKGEEFACLLIDTVHSVNAILGPALGKDLLTEADAKTLVGTLRDHQRKALVTLGAKFSNLPAEDMAICVRQTRFYRDAQESIALFTSDKFRKETTPLVTKFALDYKYLDKSPSVGFDDSSASLNFTTKYLEKVEKTGIGIKAQ